MQLNENFQKLPDSYLFSTINQKIEAYQQKHPDAQIIKLGIGDVTRPLVPGVIEALHDAVDEQANTDTFRGYGPEGGYDFLRKAIMEQCYQEKGLNIEDDEIFVSDGSKGDVANIQELFASDITIAVGDPVYPVYIDSNVIAGRLGDFNEESGMWSDLTYLSSNEENDFTPALPSGPVDLIYLCYPNNPTGTVLTKEQLQAWVDYANENNSLIIYDAAYEAYITEANIPHSIYECEGSDTCAIEVKSFSKQAGFTGLRLGYSVIPKKIQYHSQSLNQMWSRRQSTKFNGAPYIVQRAGWATYQEPAKTQIEENIAFYMSNATLIREGLESVGITTYGGINAPYIWMKIPTHHTSWEFFDYLLEEVQVVGTPGIGFGPSGEGYFRLTAFNTYELTQEAVQRLKQHFG